MSNDVAIGRFGSPFGIKGWIKVISYTDPVEQILQYLPWFIIQNNEKKVVGKIKGKLQGKQIVVQLQDCNDRDQAKAYTNVEIYIERKQLPDPQQDEYYWHDLIGLSVVNLENVDFGVVQNVFATGSNDVLIAKGQDGKERYVPYLDGVIVKVDLEQKQLVVDWDANF